ncbi:Serine phosphatase RsbU, regulator of sigma subunit [Nonomuraea maritima]|uniref:protein-serine/threonine phosphatase n=1 Tax=Nonomuraea maritima TaxID=683260 RepID=A0A1G9H5V8_9ACTN|nr:SpoIIE family protein phosphatase [Nonomuraea maritima]SDL08388.1 Serine phosphatase RsbU, regulator of sigma subunit [Nonomuraea maritima]
MAVPTPRKSERDVRALTVVDAEGIVTGWTRAAEELLGSHAAHVLGHPDRRPERPGSHPVVLRLDGHRLRTAAEHASWVLPLGSTALRDSVASILEPLIRHSSMAMWVCDTALRCVWRNEPARGMEQRVLRGVACADLARLQRRVLRDGAPVIDAGVQLSSPDTVVDRTLSVSVFRVENVHGEPVGVYTLAIDACRSRTGERLALVAEAGARIGTTLDVMRTARELAEFGVSAIADYVTVDLVESVLPSDEPLERLAGTGPGIPVFRRAGSASSRPDIPLLLWKPGEVVFVPPDSPWTKVLATGRSHVEATMGLDTSDWFDRDPMRAAFTRRYGLHSMMIVPIRARGETLGVTAFVRADNPEPFTQDDLCLAEQFVAQAALCLDNARRYTRERTAALALQRNLLPRRLSGGDALEVAHRYLPSGVHGGVGGDWYDTIPLDDGRIALVVGDVTGHGVDAAATMGSLRTAVRTLAFMNLSPADLLARLDDVIMRMNEEDSPADCESLIGMGATCLYAVYDPATRRCVLATAGHPPPALVAPGGAVAFPELPAGTPVGLGAGAYEQVTVDLAPGSLIALYTDGLVETRHADIDEGIARLGAALPDPALPLESICGIVMDAMVTGRTHEDDVALLVARTRPS